MKLDPPATAGAPETLTVRMRSCYPYEDDIRYELSYGDGTKASSGWGKPTGLQATHTYAAEGAYRIDALAVKDRHGRTLSTSPLRVPIEVAAAGAGFRNASTAGAVGSAAQSSSGRKTKSTSGGGLSSLDPKSVTVTASEGATTTIAIRGMTAPEEAQVTAVDSATGIVTAAPPSGAAFRFGVKDAKLVPRVGQKVWFDTAAGVASVDGATSCCGIVQHGGRSR
jgi:hypothetical protein